MLTVGELKAVLEGLPDSAPVCLYYDMQGESGNAQHEVYAMPVTRAQPASQTVSETNDLWLNLAPAVPDALALGVHTAWDFEYIL